MRKIIALFALMALCVMGAAKGLAPPGADPGKVTITGLIFETAPQAAVIQGSVPAIPVQMVYSLDSFARDTVLIDDDADLILPEANAPECPVKSRKISDLAFTGLWQMFY